MDVYPINNAYLYHLGDYAVLDEIGVVRVTGIDSETIVVVDDKLQEYFLNPDELKPLAISEYILEKTVFERYKIIKHPLHIEAIFTGHIHGKLYQLIGHIYDAKSIWQFNWTVIHHVHQLQSLLKIVEPKYRLVLF